MDCIGTFCDRYSVLLVWGKEGELTGSPCWEHQGVAQGQAQSNHSVSHSFSFLLASTFVSFKGILVPCDRGHHQHLVFIVYTSSKKGPGWVPLCYTCTSIPITVSGVRSRSRPPVPSDFGCQRRGRAAGKENHQRPLDLEQH